MTETTTSWLLKWPATRQMPLRYWHPTEGHVLDPNDAVRFARKVDAEMVSQRDRLQGAVAVEHKWIASLAIPAAPEQGEARTDVIRIIRKCADYSRAEGRVSSTAMLTPAQCDAILSALSPPAERTADPNPAPS